MFAPTQHQEKQDASKSTDSYLKYGIDFLHDKEGYNNKENAIDLGHFRNELSDAQYGIELLNDNEKEENVQKVEQYENKKEVFTPSFFTPKDKVEILYREPREEEDF